MKSYEQMLDEGINNLPEGVVKTERFEISKVRGHIQGNKTIITNFKEIIDSFRREQSHFLKFLLKELASPGLVDGPRLVLSRKVSSSLINTKIETYANTFVLCATCGKPDTQIIEKEGITYLKCTACGAQKQIKQNF